MGEVMNNTEMMELSAKAAGIQVTESRGGGLPFTVNRPDLQKRLWNPLSDDGDALRLAVSVGIDLFIDLHGADEPYTQAVSNGFHEEISEYHGDAPMAATRRAIVRAAAEIGKAMK